MYVNVSFEFNVEGLKLGALVNRSLWKQHSS